MDDSFPLRVSKHGGLTCKVGRVVVADLALGKIEDF